MRTATILRKKNLREVFGNWQQFLSIILIGAIAVTLFVGLLANAESLSSRVDELYAGGNVADIWATTSLSDPHDYEGVEAAVAGRGALESRFESTCKLDSRSAYAAIRYEMPNISKPYSIDAEEGQTETHFFMVDGSITSFSSDASKIEVGTDVAIAFDLSSYSLSGYSTFLDLKQYLLAGGTDIMNGSSLSLSAKVTGIMTYPENVQKASYNSSTFLMSSDIFRASLLSALRADYSERGVETIFSLFYEVLGWGDGTVDGDVSNFPAVNQYLVRLSDYGALAAVEGDINSYFQSKEGIHRNLLATVDRNNIPWASSMTQDVLEARQLTFVFPFVFFATAILVILTTIGQIILKERTQIGTMKALGLTQGQIYRHYISLTGYLVGIGTAIGLILGPILLPFIMGTKYDILYSLPARTYDFPWLYALLTVLAFMGTAALVTFLVCHKEVRLRPADSMRPFTPHVRSSALSGYVKAKSVNILSAKMAFRNLRVSLTKSFMVVFGVMGCTALLVCGYGIDDTLTHGIDVDLALFYDTDIVVQYSMPQSPENAKAALLAVDGVSDVRQYAYSSSTIELAGATGTQYSGSVIALDQSDSRFTVAFDKDKVALSSKIADKIGAKEGDDIAFTYGSKNYVGTIDVTYDSFTVNSLIVDFTSASYADMAASTNDAWIDIKAGYQPENTVDSSGNVTKKGVADAIKEDVSFVGLCESKEAVMARVQDIFSSVKIMTNAVKVFAILLAIVVLYNLALLSFRERMRDIATLKVLGFSRGEIARSLMLETMSLTAIGVFFGLLVGWPFMYIVMYINQVPLVNFLYYVAPLTYVIAFVLTFIVAFAVNFWLSMLTHKVKMVESLKSVE